MRLRLTPDDNVRLADFCGVGDANLAEIERYFQVSLYRRGHEVDPYLRPLYDALYEMLGVDAVGRFVDRGVIEIAPLAYMRGRTLEDAWIILDEAQNTTPLQMKMVLTRLGFGSRLVVTGDLSQVDLPQAQPSGLAHALRVLGDLDGIGMTRFSAADVVRHPLVERIIRAYRSQQREADDDAAP